MNDNSYRKCMYCRQRTVSPTVLPTYTTELDHDGRTYPISVVDFHVFRCANCGELAFNSASDERLTSALRAAAGLLTPAEIRANREALGYTQQQLADFMRISMFTLSRWETGGQLQQRAMDAFLRVFFRSPEARRLLGATADKQEAAGRPARAAV